MGTLSGDLSEAVGGDNAEPLTELKMIGFRPAGRASPDVVARVRVCWRMAGKEFEPTVEVAVTKEGQRVSWLKNGSFEKKLSQEVIPALKKLGMYPDRNKASESCVGLAEIGSWGEQNSWSDDSYFGVRGDNDAIAKIVADVLTKVQPVTGGGVPGSSYRGKGMSGGGGEYKYHYSSFGIGD